MLAELEPLATSWGALACAVGLGLLWGSFANVCIYRWPPTAEFPRGRSVVAPGSHCFACKTPIRWYDNVPLLSWLWLRGACRACRAPFSARYLLVEALMGLMFGVAWWWCIWVGALVEPLDARLLRFGVVAAFCFVMIVIAVIDIDHKLILDKVTLPSIAVFYVLGLAIGRSWELGLVGAVIGFGLPFVIGEIYFIAAERDGLGVGDTKLLAVVGALLGWRGVVGALLVGVLVGSVVGVLVLLRGQPAAADVPGEQSPSRLGAAVAVTAVASTVLATVAAFQGWYYVAGGGCIAAFACLVISRRLEPALQAADDPLEPTDDAPSSSVPRLLAIASALLLVSALVALMVRAQVSAIVLVSTGLATLFVAHRRHQALYPGSEQPDTADPDPPRDAPAPSLMRAELPFGPFLALGAVFYLFAEPWIVLQVALL